ncbi:hypothetical protein X798_02427 [Onchocerca flexuosa]|uniref:LSDAT_euk domain-containing protein n=2 Tax=Onchocerca flexuosa TaxID=387005 RepID=A0A183I2D3_9BILA|nr:hypothetical protein X798_02427 [Onchocerca flexuosa]VDP14936.1 unnamed protein product [Onchocerca flexuosa]
MRDSFLSSTISFGDGVFLTRTEQNGHRAEERHGSSHPLTTLRYRNEYVMDEWNYLLPEHRIIMMDGSGRTDGRCVLSACLLFSSCCSSGVEGTANA